MLKLKLQCFGHLMRRVDSLEKTLMLGGIGGRRRRGQQRMRWLDGITDSMDMSLGWTLGIGDGQGGLVCCDSWGRKELDTTEWLNQTKPWLFNGLIGHFWIIWLNNIPLYECTKVYLFIFWRPSWLLQDFGNDYTIAITFMCGHAVNSIK